MVLDQLVKDNFYPIVFVGSGISKRYLSDSPSWIQLLEKFWDKVNSQEDFYGTTNNIRNEQINKGCSDSLADFIANIKIASILEKLYNYNFNEGRIKLDGLTTKDAYKQGISPFKYAIAQVFEHYDFKPDTLDEYNSWKSFIKKSQIIITTNYDTFIENSYSDDGKSYLKKYICQEGFFDNTSGNAELFKIHGCCSAPNSIIINETDYARFNKNSILISAKILSTMITSPIIFLGYSLTDANVRKIISDFTSQLPKEDARISASRIIVIEHLKGENELIETIVQDSEIGSYTLIKTDNYKEIYDKLSQINQGLSPYEIRRYQDVVKKLIVTGGQEGTLDAILLSMDDIEKIENDIIMNKPIVVAMGDRKYMYVMPDFIPYIKDYIFEENSIMTSIAMKFVSREPIRARIPFSKYLNQITDLKKLGLSQNEEDNIRNKINKYMPTLNTMISQISPTNKKVYRNISDIWNDPSYNKNNKIDIIIYNIKKINIEEVRTFMRNEAFDLLVEAHNCNISGLKSDLRRLFFAYDLLINGDLKQI